MTADDWDLRFEQLFELYLIDVEKGFFKEQNPFENPHALEEKFEFLETQNLFYISRLQDMEQQNEELKVSAKKR